MKTYCRKLSGADPWVANKLFLFPKLSLDVKKLPQTHFWCHVSGSKYCSESFLDTFPRLQEKIGNNRHLCAADRKRLVYFFRYSQVIRNVYICWLVRNVWSPIGLTSSLVHSQFMRSGSCCGGSYDWHQVKRNDALQEPEDWKSHLLPAFQAVESRHMKSAYIEGSLQDMTRC